LKSSPSEVIGELALGNSRYGFDEVSKEQMGAWEEEISFLRNELRALSCQLSQASKWGLVLEFPIPRRQQRIDAVLIAGSLIFVLEFKAGASGAAWSSGKQAEDYALDLAYFHAPSHARVIIPAVVAPGLEYHTSNSRHSNVKLLASVPVEKLHSFIAEEYEAESRNSGAPIDPRDWDEGAYHPVPTVIEAAMALYAGMSVREIARSHAGEKELATVTTYLLDAIAKAQQRGEKIICFITGVPGAGKTLAGLNLVHNREIHTEGRPASVFMSGNGPLVEILREALALDCAERTGATRTRSRLEVRTFVQNIHHFVKDNLDRPTDQTPYEHAIVFDEAQRAWNAEQNLKKYKKRSSAWHVSEPEMVLGVMDRHTNWAVIVALVGGGQEIHNGEAGLSEWGRALAKFPTWHVHVSPEALKGGESVGGASLFNGTLHANKVREEKALHLNVSVRSHQATQLAAWVNHVLKGDEVGAARLSATFERFPIVLSRSLQTAKRWLLENTRGDRRCGLIASSGATRLRAYGIETSMAIREAYSYPHWFLKQRGDIRSSYQLEVVATEFEIQGLELDLAGLCWGGDLIWDARLKSWRPLRLVGNGWKEVDGEKAIYVQNKYRVLLTRAREGLIIWVPEGDSNDPTRGIGVMNDTAEYLIRCGATALK
jgi:hypothetical protein